MRTFYLPPILIVLMVNPSGAVEPFRWNATEQVVLVGNTLIEREQRDGYWETLLVGGHPDKDLIVRNLGWSGDTVWGHARSGFDSVQEGTKRLREHLVAAKPTVVILGYGSVEAFEGEAGLPRFEQGLKSLLDVLEPTKTRVIMLSPVRQENLGQPLPDPSEQNRRLKLYRDAMSRIASERKLHFVDLYSLPPETPDAPLTDNGIHLTPYGYWRSGIFLARDMAMAREPWRIELGPEGKVEKTSGCKVEKLEGTRRWRVTDAMLPAPPSPDSMQAGLDETWRRILQVHGLTPGRHSLHIDGELITTASAEEWARGVHLTKGPSFQQAEKLRQTINAKNRLFFHRWRPQNETYLFGFRKHEQGQYAREIPLFDPLVAQKEKEIASVRKPQPQVYEIRREP